MLTKNSLSHPQLQHFILTTRSYLLSIWTPINRKHLHSKKIINLGQQPDWDFLFLKSLNYLASITYFIGMARKVLLQLTSPNIPNLENQTQCKVKALVLQMKFDRLYYFGRKPL
jgi:hypothetical protein